MKNIIPLIFLISPLLFSCDKEDMKETPDPNAIQLLNTSNFGQILTDDKGKTLYFFSRDSKNASTCEGGCLNAWPIFYAEVLTLDEGLDEADFAIITRSNGEKQSTYKGWPLYYFANDTEPGNVNGDGANDIWWVAKPDYTVMIANSQLIGADGNNYILNDTGAYVVGAGNTFYLTDDIGNTLYGFTKDKFDKNKYTKDDFSNNGTWPIYETELAELPGKLNKEDFGVIDVFGKKQLTFHGWPLYYFGNDNARGDNKGVSVPRPGVWPVVNTDTQDAPAQ